MIEKLLEQHGTTAAMRIESLWKTTGFTAEETDSQFGAVPGRKYVLWVAQKDGKSQKGKPITKGQWFFVEV